MNRLKGLKLKFDVTDNPELSKAIQLRLFSLGADWGCNSKAVENRMMPYLYLGSFRDLEITHGITSNHFHKHPCPLSTLDSLYHLPETHIIRMGGEEISLSEESFKALKESLL